MFLKLALTRWLQQHPDVTQAALVRQGTWNGEMLYKYLLEMKIERINWSYYFRENPQYTEFTWDLIAMRWELPDWVVVIEGEEPDERLEYTKDIAKRFDFNLAVLSPHDRISL